MGAAEANDRSPNVAKVFTEGGSRRSSEVLKFYNVCNCVCDTEPNCRTL